MNHCSCERLLRASRLSTCASTDCDSGVFLHAADVSDPELLKVMLEAVSDSVHRRAAEGQEGAGAAFSSPSLGPDA
eukprot:365594-Chlamydomonas_euryale.AAC.3